MYKALKQLFGIGPRVDYSQLVRDGAVILDVRSLDEFNKEHIPGAVNIPIEDLRYQQNKLAKPVPIIACCNDGSKSWYAKNFLDASGYRAVYDAGSWKKLQQKLQGT